METGAHGNGGGKRGDEDDDSAKVTTAVSSCVGGVCEGVGVCVEYSCLS